MYKILLILLLASSAIADTTQEAVKIQPNALQSAPNISNGILLFITTIWTLFTTWILIFISPIYPNIKPDILWIIIPIWLNFIVTELYQEKNGTTFGNAIQNGLVAGLIGIDWMRYLTRTITEASVTISHELILKYLVSIIVFMYGCIIVYHGIKGRDYVKQLARIRAVTYILVIFAPAIYGIVELSLNYTLSILLFYPLFYTIIDYCNKNMPNTNMRI
ncbi:MAG: hypothetical protein AABX52_01210 [Nanoarchaeota archaeon]